ncbi:MAG TPA: Maf family protein [Anaerolineaceae bacterium]
MLQSGPMVDPLILLASNSPRRRQLLSLSGLRFQVWPANIDESRLEGEVPEAYVMRVARVKARALTLSAENFQASFILAADTVVVDGEAILGKPVSQAEAGRMLRQLRARPHRVFTALALIALEDRRLFTELCVTQVPMRAYSDEEIEAYIASGDPMDKAGAYAIQNKGFHPVASLQGCFANVMGLPLCHLVRTLRQVGVTPLIDVPGACQAALSYDCPVSSSILQGEQTG